MFWRVTIYQLYFQTVTDFEKRFLLPEIYWHKYNDIICIALVFKQCNPYDNDGTSNSNSLKVKINRRMQLIYAGIFALQLCNHTAMYD